MFDREFIKAGVFDREMSRVLHRAFDLRQKGDYMEEAEVSREDVEEMLPQAIDFVKNATSHLLR